MKNHDHVICLLGTTRGKSGAEGFVKIDKDYVLNVARAAREANVPHFHLMTSQGWSIFIYFTVFEVFYCQNFREQCELNVLISQDERPGRRGLCGA